MESNKNNDINNGGDQHQHQQLRESARKRQFNELANDVDVDQPADEEDQQQGPENCNKKNRGGQRGNDALEKLHLESLTREELIQLVQKQLLEKNEQAEEFSQRILQLEQEKAEVDENLNKKMAEIVEMHKEVEEKSEELAEKAKQIDALLIQLNESSNQHQNGLPTEEEMKIQLSLETWYDMLAFVPRHQLGQIVPQIGDRKFASILQKFLHAYGEIMIAEIEIVAPYEEDPSGHPRVRRTWQNRSPLRFEMAESQMPTNIKNFNSFELSYFDQSVLNFMQKFQQNGLLDNVNLWFSKLSSEDIIQPVLCHLLPLFKGIVTIIVHSTQLADIYDAGNSKEIYDLYMKMMEKTRILALYRDPENLHTDRIDLYCRWLYQTSRADGKPRVLFFGRRDLDSTPISLFVDRIRQDFLVATQPSTFLIRINLPKAFQPLETICLDNGKTKEKLQTKIEDADPKSEEVVLMISRYPQASTKKWTEENEKEVLNCNFSAKNDRTIYLSYELQVVAI